MKNIMVKRLVTKIIETTIKRLRDLLIIAKIGINWFIKKNHKLKFNPKKVIFHKWFGVSLGLYNLPSINKYVLTIFLLRKCSICCISCLVCFIEKI